MSSTNSSRLSNSEAERAVAASVASEGWGVWLIVSVNLMMRVLSTDQARSDLTPNLELNKLWSFARVPGVRIELGLGRWESTL